MTRARSLSQLANSNVFTVATNNRIGIGSDAPTTKLDVDGALNVSGNAAFGGVVTYEDVTNIDSVGIITARSGVSVPDSQKIQLGGSNDLQIYHDGSHSYISESSGTGDLRLVSSRTLIRDENDANHCIIVNSGGSVDLYHNGNKKFETTSTGVSITGASTFSGNLTLGTDKVVLDATSGASTFASTMTIGGNPNAGANAGSKFLAQGVLQVARNGSNPVVQAFQTGTASPTLEVLADGSATFAGTVYADDKVRSGGNANTGAAAGSLLNPEGNIQVARANSAGTVFQGYTVGSSTATTTIRANGTASFAGTGTFLRVDAVRTDAATGYAFTAGNANSLENAIIKGDGSATFAGSIASEGEISVDRAASSSTSGFRVFGGGVVKSTLFTDGSASFAGTDIALDDTGIYLMDGGSAGSGNYRSRVLTDGTAQFASGAFVVSSTGNLAIDRTSGTNDILNGKLNGTVTSTINADGSAEFAGGNINLYTNGSMILTAGATFGSEIISASGGTPGSNNTIPGVRINTSNSGNVLSYGGVFRVYSNGGSGNYSNITAEINNDGSADFDGIITSGTFNATSNTTTGVECGSGGMLSVQRLSGSGASSVFRGYQGATINSEILADGSATFAGDILAGSDPTNGAAAGIKILSTGTVLATKATGNTLWAGYKTGTSLATSTIMADGSANFAAQKFRVASSGETIIDGSASVAGSTLFNCKSAYNSGNSVASILADGSASFAGSVDAVYFRGDATSGGNIVWRGMLNGSTTSNIYGDGSASFAGGLTATAITCNHPSSSAGQTISSWSDQVSGSIVFQSGGSATFTGGVTFGDNAVRGTVNEGSTTSQGSRLGHGIVVVQQPSSNSATNHLYQGWSGTTLTSRIQKNGDAVFNGSVTENASDRKFKENIADAPSQLADIAALQLRTWDWNELAPGTEERNARHRMGLVAQEAELVDPNLAYEVSEGEDSYKAIDYKVLTMKLLGAVAELKAEVEALKNA